MNIGGKNSTGPTTNTWLTPKEYIDALGPFDFDPCAAPEPRPWPTARAHNTWPSDGLAVEWKGRVWLNPPYGREAEAFMQKLVAHGRGTALVFARVETAWFVATVWEAATAVLFPKGRIAFCRPDGTPVAGNGVPSVFAAYGDYDATALMMSGIDGKFIAL